MYKFMNKIDNQNFNWNLACEKPSSIHFQTSVRRASTTTKHRLSETPTSTIQYTSIFVQVINNKTTMVEFETWNFRQAIAITQRPAIQSASPTTSTRTQLPATTFRPQLLQVSVTPRPALLYTPKSVSPSPAPSKGVRKSLIFFAIVFESCLF